MPMHKSPHAGDAADQDRIGKAHAMLAGADPAAAPDPDQGEDALLEELAAAVDQADSALQQAKAALEKLRGAEDAEPPDQGVPSPSAAGAV